MTLCIQQEKGEHGTKKLVLTYEGREVGFIQYRCTRGGIEKVTLRMVIHAWRYPVSDFRTDLSRSELEEIQPGLPKLLTEIISLKDPASGPEIHYTHFDVSGPYGRHDSALKRAPNEFYQKLLKGDVDD